jgi:hypothetical protein
MNPARQRRSSVLRIISKQAFKMVYLELKNDYLDLKGFYDNLEKLFIEIDGNGHVIREVGFNSNNHVVHKFPGDFKYGRYGIFDLSVFDMKHIRNELSKETFELAWNM